jgi:hypothetical protein
MSEKQTFEIEVGISWTGGETVSMVVIDATLNHYDGIISRAFQDAKDIGELDEFPDITEEDCEYDVRIIDSYLEDIGITDATELEEFCYIFYYKDNSYEYDVFKAAYDCGIPFYEIGEYYAGQWDDDEDFVQNLLEDTGDLPRDLPHYIHIDWGMTARGIMMDYTESNGHYFRQ